MIAAGSNSCIAGTDVLGIAEGRLWILLRIAGGSAESTAYSLSF